MMRIETFLEKMYFVIRYLKFQPVASMMRIETGEVNGAVWTTNVLFQPVASMMRIETRLCELSETVLVH